MALQLIAEIGQAHDGSLGILHSYIDAVAGTGFPIIKFQMHLAEAESSLQESFRIPFSYEDASRMDYWRRMEFSFSQWQEIKSHCEEKGLEFLATPFCLAAVDLLEKLEVKRYKVGSGDINNHLLLDCIAQTHKPVILSSGMSSWQELDEAVNCIKKYHTALSLMQCTTAYPCKPEDWGLEQIPRMKSRYDLPVGYSDHSGTLTAGIAAWAKGAELLEVHAVFDRRMFGPDALASLTIDELYQLNHSIQLLELSKVGNDLKSDPREMETLKIMFGKSLAVNKHLKSGHSLTYRDLETKKPAGMGIDAKLYRQLLGKRLNKDLQANSFINWDDVT